MIQPKPFKPKMRCWPARVGLGVAFLGSGPWWRCAGLGVVGAGPTMEAAYDSWRLQHTCSIADALEAIGAPPQRLDYAPPDPGRQGQCREAGRA